MQTLDSYIFKIAKPFDKNIDNGPEFTSYKFVEWAKRKDIKLQYIQPGKPVQNSYIERFNRTYRQEKLGAYLFDELTQVRSLTEEWINMYNRQRPHSSLDDITPNEVHKEPKGSPDSLLLTVSENWE